MTTKMQTAQISKPGGDWEVVEREIPEPGPGHVRVKVEACGICNSDVFVKEGRAAAQFIGRIVLQDGSDNGASWKGGGRC